jgi:uncharacterized protein (UPF0248 family)
MQREKEAAEKARLEEAAKVGFVLLSDNNAIPHHPHSV